MLTLAAIFFPFFIVGRAITVKELLRYFFGGGGGVNAVKREALEVFFFKKKIITTLSKHLNETFGKENSF